MSRSRKRRSKRKSGLVSLKVKFIFWLLLIAVIGWGGTTLFRGYKMIEAIEAPAGHDFIVSDNPDSITLLLVQQSSQPASLDELAVTRVNFSTNAIKTLRLPVQVSDGRTNVGQYIESRYYKEAQIAIEQQLALPIDGYVIQTRAQQQEEASVSVLSVLTGQAVVNLWDMTVGMPFTLGSINPIHTSLSPQQVWQTLWLASQEPIDTIAVSVPPSALEVIESKAVLNPAVIDPIIKQNFTYPTIQEQQTTVVVKNGTPIEGLASQMGRFVSNMGGEIVAVESADTNNEKSSITSYTQSALSQKLSSYLGITEDKQSKTGRERSDVEIIVGTDALTRLGQ